MTLRWLAGAPAVREAIERWQTTGDGTELRDNPRRRIVRVEGGAAGPLLVKHFRLGSGRHARRERWKARIGRSPASREFAALEALFAAGVPVPEPLGLARRADGDRLLIVRWLEGSTWEELRGLAAGHRRRAAEALGAAVAQLHEAGFAHGDLHRGNVLFTEDGPVLLDLQHAVRTSDLRARRADLGHLDYSLWGRASLAERIRTRAAALGLPRPFGPTAREDLRAAGRAADERAHAHGRSRTRRAARPGRRFARLELDGARGLRMRDVRQQDVAGALAEHAETLARGGERVWKDDGRSRITAVRLGELPVVVKEVLPRGLGRRLADAWRGSPGRRAWRAGHGLLARGVGAATPLAYLEERRFGIPWSSRVILEDLSASPDALDMCEHDPAGVERALHALLRQLHLRTVDHGDLKCTNVHVEGYGDAARARLVDLEGVRFPAALSEDRRIAALAELNASLPTSFPAEARCRVFERYSAALRFARPRADVRGEIVSRSLARNHRWHGEGCRDADAP